MEIFLRISPTYYKNAVTYTRLKPIVWTSVDWGAGWSKVFSNPLDYCGRSSQWPGIKAVKEGFRIFLWERALWAGRTGEREVQWEAVPLWVGCAPFLPGPHSNDNEGCVVIFLRQLPQGSFGVLQELSGGQEGFGHSFSHSWNCSFIKFQTVVKIFITSITSHHSRVLVRGKNRWRLVRVFEES